MSKKQWNWEQDDWPNFVFDYNALAPLEKRFQRESGTLFGSVKHIAGGDLDQLTIEILSQEAEKTSAIEGEPLNRESLQSSIRKNLGLDPGREIKSTPAEIGISDAGPDGFEGGLSSKNYQSIARTSSATATRDLKNLVQIGALTSEGALKATRYNLNL